MIRRSSRLGLSSIGPTSTLGRGQWNALLRRLPVAEAARFYATSTGSSGSKKPHPPSHSSKQKGDGAATHGAATHASHSKGSETAPHKTEPADPIPAAKVEHHSGQDAQGSHRKPQEGESPQQPRPEEGEDVGSAPALDEREAAEREKDARFARNLKIGLAGFVCLIPAFYLGNKWGRKAYWGSEGSVRLSQSARGKPSLGGPFSLVTHDGEPVSQAQYLGKWCFFYFGFVHCPEICPVELNRMTKVVKWVREAKPGVQLQPLFVSCDPKRDSLLAIKEYLSVFHPDFIGLVGTPEQVNETCKSYRIYYSVPTADQGKSDDYLIDHSIAIFLFDPKGQFVDFFGTRYTEEEIRDKVLTYMGKYEADPTWTNW